MELPNATKSQTSSALSNNKTVAVKNTVRNVGQKSLTREQGLSEYVLARGNPVSETSAFQKNVLDNVKVENLGDCVVPSIFFPNQFIGSLFWGSQLQNVI